MSTDNPLEQPNVFANRTAQSADQAIKATQRVANDALNTLAGSVEDMRQQATPLLNRATQQVNTLAQQGMDTVRDTSQQLREQAIRAADSTVSYVKEEPVKAMLIAAATGAALMALVSLMSRSRDRG
ncbi:hypothetical protein [Rhodoferax sediminis]|uniref:DUF883 family protein n=1 Tax=Rhodoferax sediminis TaxID=2509614 RepID=A0A515D8N5_9BURK|nr:hypothetical protein [Rhodoferax sediminis]QDL36767.1 hypothetical protein EUB48_05235 [Rhodoferax sediminis]